MAKQITRRTYYTLVRHSAYVGRQDPAFKRAVEEWAIDGANAMKAVVAAGGRIFNDYAEARKQAFCFNYPEADRGLIPQAGGTFRGAVDGMPIFVPGDAPPDDAREVPRMAAVPSSFFGITGVMTAETNLALMHAVGEAGVDPADAEAVLDLWNRLRKAKAAAREGEP